MINNCDRITLQEIVRNEIKGSLLLCPRIMGYLMEGKDGHKAVEAAIFTWRRKISARESPIRKHWDVESLTKAVEISHQVEFLVRGRRMGPAVIASQQLKELEFTLPPEMRTWYEVHMQILALPGPYRAPAQ